MKFLHKDIIAIGHTEGEGMVLLINKADIDNPPAKACQFEFSTRILSCFDTIQNPITFNAFLKLKMKNPPRPF